MISNPDAVLRAVLCREPLFIYENEVPDDVLSGFAIESFFCWLSFWVSGCPRIACETEDLARLVRCCLEAERLHPMPAIRVMEGQRHAA